MASPVHRSRRKRDCIDSPWARPVRDLFEYAVPRPRRYDDGPGTGRRHRRHGDIQQRRAEREVSDHAAVPRRRRVGVHEEQRGRWPERRALRNPASFGADDFLSKRTDVYFVDTYRRAGGADSTGRNKVSALSTT